MINSVMNRFLPPLYRSDRNCTFWLVGYFLRSRPRQMYDVPSNCGKLCKIRKNGFKVPSIKIIYLKKNCYHIVISLSLIPVYPAGTPYISGAAVPSAYGSWIKAISILRSTNKRLVLSIAFFLCCKLICFTANSSTPNYSLVIQGLYL